MRKLMLANNRLEAVPQAVRAMRSLELLRLANNKIDRIPHWLVHGLPVLSWLALAGNPALQLPLPRSTLETVNMSSFDLLETLGEGTSGVVHK